MLEHYSTIITHLKAAGFEVLEAVDIALEEQLNGSASGWWESFQGGYTLSNFKHTRPGRFVTNKFCEVLEMLRVAPKGTATTAHVLAATGDALASAGESGIFTPMSATHADRCTERARPRRRAGTRADARSVASQLASRPAADVLVSVLSSSVPHPVIRSFACQVLLPGSQADQGRGAEGRRQEGIQEEVNRASTGPNGSSKGSEIAIACMRGRTRPALAAFPDARASPHRTSAPTRTHTYTTTYQR